MTDRQLLVEAKQELEGFTEKLGDVYQEKSLDNLKFDVQSTAETVYAVLGVLATVGGTIQLVEWIIQKARNIKNNKKGLIVIVLDGQVIELSPKTDVDNLRSELQPILEKYK
jgi:hypothetical protein